MSTQERDLGPGTMMEERRWGRPMAPGGFYRSPTIGQLAAAMARAQTKFDAISKDKEATIQTRGGGSYSYAYADLNTCLKAVRPALNAEGIALFQPISTRIDPDGLAWVVATTLLVLGEEWISNEYASPVVDVNDARACGSAGTFARRYGGLGMFGVFPEAEDDDGEQARGGAHEMEKGKAEPACPVCGLVGAIMKGAAQYGGGSLCWAKRGGCGTKWPKGTSYPPTSAPLEQDLTPKQKSLPVDGNTKEAKAPAVPRGPERAQVAGQPGQVATAAPAQPAQGGDAHPPALIEDDGLPDEPQTFVINKVTYTTKGLTQEQVLETFRLFPAVDHASGTKGRGTQIMTALFGVSTRKELTRKQGKVLIQHLRAEIEDAAGAGTV